MINLKWWRFAGIIAIAVFGFLLHYLYSWTDSSKIIGLFVPVNESVWEHLKLGYWSVVLFSIVEYLQIRFRVNNYYFAKTVGVIAMDLAIIIIFYGYTFITGRNILVLDISSYIIGAFICQYLTYLLFRLKPFPKFSNRTSLAALISIAVLFGIATYYPPHIALFKDNNSNTFGINKEK